MQGTYLGPSYDQTRIAADLDRLGAEYRKLDDDKLFVTVADALNGDQLAGACA